MVMKPGFPSERAPRLPACRRETRSHPSPTFLCASCTSPKPIARSFSSRLVSWSVVSFTRDRLDDVATCGGGQPQNPGAFLWRKRGHTETQVPKGFEDVLEWENEASKRRVPRT